MNLPVLFWDASALIKRYWSEIGSPTVNALFAADALYQMATTPWGYTETCSLLQRKRNAGDLTSAAFRTQFSALQTEVIASNQMSLRSVTEADVFSSVTYIQKHNINATDAAILTALLAYAQLPQTPVCVLVAADKRLVRAAEAEGLRTLNPELVAAADVPAFLASL